MLMRLASGTPVPASFMSGGVPAAGVQLAMLADGVDGLLLHLDRRSSACEPPAQLQVKVAKAVPLHASVSQESRGVAEKMAALVASPHRLR